MGMLRRCSEHGCEVLTIGERCCEHEPSGAAQRERRHPPADSAGLHPTTRSSPLGPFHLLTERTAPVNEEHAVVARLGGLGLCVARPRLRKERQAG